MVLSSQTRAIVWPTKASVLLDFEYSRAYPILFSWVKGVNGQTSIAKKEKKYYTTEFHFRWHLSKKVFYNNYLMKCTVRKWSRPRFCYLPSEYFLRLRIDFWCNFPETAGILEGLDLQAPFPKHTFEFPCWQWSHKQLVRNQVDRKLVLCRSNQW